MHDYDIMLLKYNEKVNFARTVKSMLRSFADNKIYQIDYSDVIYDIDPKSIPYRCQQVIKLDEKKDKKVIEMLSNIKDGYRNSFIRNVIRLYVSSFFLFQYQIEKKEFPIIADKESVKPFKKIEKKKKDEFTEKLIKNAKEQKEKKAEQNLLEGTNRLDPNSARNSPKPVQNAEKGSVSIKTDGMKNNATKQESISESLVSSQKPMQNTANNPFGSQETNAQNDFDFFKNLMG